MASEYFAALSISSLASDDESVSIDGNASYVSQSAIYQQLSNIEEITSNFYVKKPIALDPRHGSFTELEYDQPQDFEFQVTTFSQHDVVTITTLCLPNFTLGENVTLSNQKRLKPGQDHCALVFNLDRIVHGRAASEKMQIRPILINGEYSITLTNSHGLVPGTYRFTVGLADVAYYAKLDSKAYADVHAIQAIRVQYNKLSTVRTTPLEHSKQVPGKVLYNEMNYYRFVCTNPHQVVSIVVTPVCTEGSSYAGDADLYVTNRGNGQIAVTKENCVWQNNNLGTSRIDILPGDMNLPDDVKESRVFLIGVAAGSQELVEYQLCVTQANPPPCTLFDFSAGSEQRTSRDASYSEIVPCAEQGYTMDLTLEEGESHYFALRLPFFADAGDSLVEQPQQDGSSIVVLVHHIDELAGASHARLLQHFGDASALLRDQEVNQASGCGVYTSDTLASAGVLGSDGRIERLGVPAGDQRDQREKLWPVVYASAEVVFPSAEAYTWRASSANDQVVLLVKESEWKHVSSLLYFAVHGTSAANPAANTVPSVHNIPTKRPIRISVWKIQSPSPVSKTQYLCRAVYSGLYENIDGSQISLSDRNYDTSGSHSHSPKNPISAKDDLCYTYFDTEYAPMVQLLRAAGAKDGQVMYDLGCGTGRAVVAAALSEIRFVKCVGVELLPSLAAVAQGVVQRLNNLRHDHNMLFRTPQVQPAMSESDQRLRNRIEQLQFPFPQLEIWHANILATDWSDADFVYAASLCFSEQLVQQIVSQASQLRPGARLVTFKVPDNHHQTFELEKTVPVHLFCGVVPAYVLVRTAHLSAYGVE